MGNHEQPPRGDVRNTKLLCSVYGLFSTENGKIRYIGQTLKPLEVRLTQHIAAAKSGVKTHCYYWMRRAFAEGYDIGIFLLEGRCEWNEAERRWIAEYNRDFPGTLVNTSEGGCGYTGKRPESVRAKMRGPKTESHKAAMRKPKSDVTRSKMSRSLVGNSRSRGEANRTAVLSESDVILIRKRLADGERGSQIAREYGVQKAAISKIKLGRSWSYLAS